MAVSTSARPAMIDDHDVARQVVRFVEVLGGEQDVGPLRDERADGVPELDPAAGVQSRRRFVE